MKFIILTIFPEAFESYFSISLIKRALAKKFIKIEVRNLRDWTTDAHKTVDDRPYGGGVGMVMKVDVVDRALKTLKSEIRPPRLDGESRPGNPKSETILLTPQGEKFTQKLAKKLSRKKNLILICGRYEGFDERIRKLVDIEISIGDYVLTGGEIPAMIIVDAVARMIPGVVGKFESTVNESFFPLRGISHSETLLEYPQYTRPEVYKQMKVPKVLLTGNHAKIAGWRKVEALKRTKKRRPDLLAN